MIIPETIAVAFAMFSAVPMPQFPWNEKNMRYALCAFPLIGAVCALGWLPPVLWRMPVFLQGALLTLWPVWVTGGIHLDGFADTCDALSSCAAPEKKLEILKDSHCGAFAVIRLCSYFAAMFALCATVQCSRKTAWLMLCAFVLERCLSGLAIAAFPLAKGSGLAHSFATAADRRTVKLVLLGGSVLLSGCMAWLGCVWMAAAAWCVWAHYYHTAKKQFGGITGDLAGWFLQRAELAMLCVLVLCQQGGWL